MPRKASSEAANRAGPGFHPGPGSAAPGRKRSSGPGGPSSDCNCNCTLPSARRRGLELAGHDEFAPGDEVGGQADLQAPPAPRRKGSPRRWADHPAACRTGRDRGPSERMGRHRPVFAFALGKAPRSARGGDRPQQRPIERVGLADQDRVGALLALAGRRARGGQQSMDLTGEPCLLGGLIRLEPARQHRAGRDDGPAQAVVGRLGVEVPHIRLAAAIGVRVAGQDVAGDIRGEMPSIGFVLRNYDLQVDLGQVAAVVAVARADPERDQVAGLHRRGLRSARSTPSCRRRWRRRPAVGGGRRGAAPPTR